MFVCIFQVEASWLTCIRSDYNIHNYKQLLLYNNACTCMCIAYETNTFFCIHAYRPVLLVYY